MLVLLHSYEEQRELLVASENGVASRSRRLGALNPDEMDAIATDKARERMYM